MFWEVTDYVAQHISKMSGFMLVKLMDTSEMFIGKLAFFL